MKTGQEFEGIKDTKRHVLDKGYVRLVNYYDEGDLNVVNAARASFTKESDELTVGDLRLLEFLMERDEMSPFRHAFITFEVKAPLMVARQWWKYVVGSDHTMDSWNETSRRYVTSEPEFYIPYVNQWRGQPDNMKQGSKGTLDEADGLVLTDMLHKLIDHCMSVHRQAELLGVATEEARLFLPAYGMYTTWRWSCSLQSCLWFLHQRMAEKAQSEIRDYAIAVFDIVKMIFPESVKLQVAKDAKAS